MFLKRLIVLAGGVLLAIAFFVGYVEYSKAEMEGRFRAEREKFHLDHLQLTAATANGETPAPNPVPLTGAPSDTNTLIGPVPPPDAGSAPAPSSDSSATPAPAPDTNTAPATPSAPSTLNFPRPANAAASVFQFAAYRPGAITSSTSALVIGQTNAAVPDAPAEPPAAAMTPPPLVAAPAPATGESSVIVLLYHQFVPAGVQLPPKAQWTMNQDVFESEMKYIHDNGYHVVPLSDVVKFIKHQISLPPGSVCITIDDGFKSAIVYAAPILKKYGYPWTFYIYPAFITTAEGRGACSWNDLLELQREGIDIECHSMTHPQLTHKGNKTPEQYAAWLKNETAGAKAILEQHLGRPVTSFAYPFGAYNKQVEQAVIDAGFETILTVADNPVHSTTSLHSIGRYTITRNVVKNFAAYLHQSALSLTKAEPEPGATISNPQPVISAVLTQMSADALDPASLETQVRDMGVVKHDFDPATNTVRIYLPRPLIEPVEFVNIRVRDAKTGQIMVANWQFNYEPGAGATIHPPIPKSAPTPPPAPAPAAAAPAPSPSTAASAPAPAPGPSQPHLD